MPEFASFAPTAEQHARLKVALITTLPWAESRAEDLSEAATAAPEDPDSQSAKAVWERVSAAQALLDVSAPEGWQPEEGDWVYHGSPTNPRDFGIGRVIAYDPTSEQVRIDFDSNGVTEVELEEVIYLSRPGPAERDDRPSIALETPGDIRSDVEYVLNIPDGTSRRVWLQAGNAALCVSKFNDDLKVVAYPNKDGDSTPWAEFVIDDAFAPDAPSMKP